jgi:hypothetical protein
MERAGHTERAGPIAVMYTPALQPAWEARDVAVAAYGLPPSRKTTSMLEARKMGADLLR